jgi:DNA-binding XRE family transcriptional regulator
MINRGNIVEWNEWRNSMSDFAKRLIYLRNIRAIDQAYIAKALDVDRSTVCVWETGRSEPSTVTVRALAALYGVEVSWLYAPWDELRNEIDKKYRELAKKAGMTDMELHSFIQSYWMFKNIDIRVGHLEVMEQISEEDKRKKKKSKRHTMQAHTQAPKSNV